MQNNTMSISLWQKDGMNGKDILPVVKSLSCNVRGML